MATNGLGTLAVYLTADTGGLNRGLAKAGQMIGSFKGLLLGALGVGGVGLLAKQSIEAYGIQERNEKKLGAVLKATGYAAGFSLGELKKYASELQEMTEYGDEANLTTMGILATFRNIKGDTFRDATAAALDMATVLGQSADSAAMMIGKALNDPAEGISKLSRSGVTFSKEQEAAIKKLVSEGKTYEAQMIMLKELQMEFGGAAKAAAESTQGRLKQLSNAMGDLKEGIGAVIVETISLGSTANGVTSSIGGWASYLRDNAAELGFMFQSVFIDIMAGFKAILALGNLPILNPLITGIQNAGTLVLWLGESWIRIWDNMGDIAVAVAKDLLHNVLLIPTQILNAFVLLGEAIWKALMNPAKAKEAFTGMFEGILNKAIEDVSAIGRNTDKAFAKAKIEPPELKDIEFGSMSKVWDEWAKIEDDRLNKQAGLEKNYLAEIEKTRKENEQKTPGSDKKETAIEPLKNNFAERADTALSGSIEAYRARFSGQDNILKATLKVNEKIAVASEETANATKQMAQNQYDEAKV